MHTTQTIGPVTVTVDAAPGLLDTYRVKVAGRRARTFRGESAWSDAERFANDALTELQGTPFGDRFVL